MLRVVKLIFLLPFLLPLAVRAQEQSRVLIVGDSHVVGHFGTNLARIFEGAGAQVTRRGIVGSKPSAWTRGPLQSLIAQQRPNLMVFEFGDNLTNYRASTFSPSVIEEEIQGLMDAIPHDFPPERCFFVTPTFGEPGPINGADFGKNTQRLRRVIEVMTRVIQRNQNRCYVIDSTRLPNLTETTDRSRRTSTSVTTFDSLHLDEASGRRWAQSVHGRIQSRLQGLNIIPAGAAPRPTPPGPGASLPTSPGASLPGR